MAICEMKKLTLLGMNADRPKLMRTLQRMGCVEIVDAAEDAAPEEVSDTASAAVERLDWAIAKLSPYDAVSGGLFKQKRVAGEDALAAAQAAKGELMSVVDRLEEIERTRGELRAKTAREQAIIEQLSPWAELNEPLSKLSGTRNAVVELVSVPENRADALREAFAALPIPPAAETISNQQGRANWLVCAHRDVSGALDMAVNANGAERVQLEVSEFSPGVLIGQAEERLKRYTEIPPTLVEEEKRLARSLDDMKVLRDVEVGARDRQLAARKFATTKSAFLLKGWAPTAKVEALEKAIRRTGCTVEYEFADPDPEEKAPTLLRNNGVVTPFESIVRMFSMPDYRGLDPTSVMLPFFVCFFGMMVSDAGYGIVLTIGAALLARKLNKKGGIGQIAAILTLGGVATVFWGAMFGGWFGIETKPLLLVPMKEPLPMMILCLALGGVHIFTGMGVAAYMNVKRGKVFDAICDQGFWFLLLIGAVLMILAPEVGKYMALAGGAGIILTGGRQSKNVVGKLIGGFGALYGVTGYASDVLSYARLFGMGLATGVIGMVINTVAEMLMTSPVGWVFAIVILIGGHTFNLAINALGAYVHACRLQYIEFFGRFYESGGAEFKPLRHNTKYVDIAEGES